MNRSTSLTVTLALVVLSFAAPSAAQSSPACTTVMDAMKKQAATPNHSTLTIAGATQQTSESINAGGVLYIKVGATWMKSPVSAEESLAHDLAPFNAAHGYTCGQVADDTVDGLPTAVYTMHRESSDGRVWIAKSTGLIVKIDESSTVNGGKLQMSVHSDYKDIHAPVVK